ncbi:MAG: hypothetical protein MOGMAGMI_00165 [Candidatus Omnitrophica bacterium]|nr:hypothetical protein [Candidatus Omnitrophota bacterium]
MPVRHRDLRLEREHGLTTGKITFGYWNIPFSWAEAFLDGTGTVLRWTGLWQWGLRHALEYRVREHRIRHERGKGGLSGYRILHLSDLHAEGISDGGRSLRERIRAIPADVCVLTGDFRYHEKGDGTAAVRLTASLFEGLTYKHGIYAVLGNHDSVRMVPQLESAGIRVLLNEGVAVERGGLRLWLAGVDDPHYYRLHDIDRALEGARPEDLKLLLAHSPDIAPEAAGRGVDVYLCGHAHGGQICLPGGVPIIANLRVSRKYFAGPWTHDRMIGYTSRGSGASGLPVRYFSHPEITIHIFE